LHVSRRPASYAARALPEGRDVAATLLVTGANGFVGRVLCTELAQSGFGVRAAVREASRAAGLPATRVSVGDLSASTDWSNALDGVDAVVHLAARVHVMDEKAADPLHAFRSLNVDVTRALAEAAARRGVKRFVYVSSIKVNGESTRLEPFHPDDVPNPSDPYAVSKWEAEQCLWRICAETGLEGVVVRPPLVYGPGVGGNFLRLLKLVRRGVPLPFGAVENRRSMIYVGNLARALIACATDARAAGKTYLASDGRDLSTAELVRRLGDAMGVRARLVPIPPGLLKLAGSLTGKTAEVDRLIGSLALDSSHLLATLGWVPPYPVEEGLLATARWFTSAAP
jgi:nucleoside-diphosphate-sugar epimerase